MEPELIGRLWADHPEEMKNFLLALWIYGGAAIAFIVAVFFRCRVGVESEGVVESGEATKG